MEKGFLDHVDLEGLKHRIQTRQKLERFAQ